MASREYHKEYYEKNKIHINSLNISNNRKLHKKYPWLRVFNNSKSRCENPKNNMYYCYGAKGIKFLLTLEEVKELWFRDKAYNLEKPSIDREDNDKDYTFDNCRFIELGMNSIERNKRITKTVLQYSLDCMFIKEWKSIILASKNLKINPSSICQTAKRKRPSAGGYIWRYK